MQLLKELIDHSLTMQGDNDGKQGAGAKNNGQSETVLFTNDKTMINSLNALCANNPIKYRLIKAFSDSTTGNCYLINDISVGIDVLQSQEKRQAETKLKEQKHKYGDYQKVLLTDNEYLKLVNGYGEEKTKKAIKYLDEYIEMKGYKAKSHYLCIIKWVFDAVNEREKKRQPLNKKAQELDDFYRMTAEWAQKEE